MILIEQEMISEPLIDLLLKQCHRQKSVFRAAAFRALRLLFPKIQSINTQSLHDSMIDSITNGAEIALENSLKCLCFLNDESKCSILDSLYNRLSKSNNETASQISKIIQSIPESDIPSTYVIPSK